MQKGTRKEPMAPVLDDLLHDGRLARLFSKDDRHCAMQLWVLQIKSEQSTENRVIYGRLLPYSYSSNSWSASDDDNFRTFGQVQAQVIRLNLYVNSGRCADLLRQLSTGQTVSAISEQVELELSIQLKARFGATTLAADDLVYRPVAYLLNRDAHDRRSPSSPHGGAGAFSASITRADKGSLFRLGHEYDVALTSSVIKHLNADTGLDFGGVDSPPIRRSGTAGLSRAGRLGAVLAERELGRCSARLRRAIQSDAGSALQQLPVPAEHRE